MFQMMRQLIPAGALFSFKNAGICYTRFISSSNHYRGLTCECNEKVDGFLGLCEVQITFL